MQTDAERFCSNCEKITPPGCRHIHGDQKECLLGARGDARWTVGMAIWRDLTDRSGIAGELESTDEEIQAEIIETIGQKAIDAMKTIEVPK